MVSGAPAAPVTARLSDFQPGARRELHGRGVARRLAGCHGERGHVLVVLQRADGCSISELQVVPRPPAADPFVVERLVVADDPSGNPVNAG